jgi:hypothetical protein
MLGKMFVAHDVVLDVGFATARPRLLELIGGSGLTGVSRAAYDDGLETILRAVPFGAVPPGSRLISVRFLAPSERNNGLTTALRWEARGATGDLFPVLDADIALTPAGPAITRLALAGIYRSPFGRPGATADHVVMRRVADVTVHALLETIGGSLTAPVPSAEPQPSCDGPALFRPAREPGAP